MIAASLKVFTSVSVPLSVPVFPRSYDRGLIEGGCSLSPLNLPTCFRDHMIAASLKGGP